MHAGAFFAEGLFGCALLAVAVRMGCRGAVAVAVVDVAVSLVGGINGGRVVSCWLEHLAAGFGHG